MTTLYTPEQVVERFPLIKLRWLYRMAREGRIDHVRLERNRLAFTGDQVEALIERHIVRVSPATVQSLVTPRSRRRRGAA